MQGRHKLFFAAWMFLAAGVATGEAPRRMEIYPAGFTDPQGLYELVLGVVGDRGQVVLDEKNARLLVITTDAVHAQLRPIVAAVNVPVPNVRVTVRIHKTLLAQGQHAGLDTAGSFVVGREGLGTTLEFKPHLAAGQQTATSDITETVVVSSGREAGLMVGEEIPYLEWIMECGRRWRLVAAQVQWQQVGARLLVAPVVIGNGPMIRVRVTPELSGLVDGRPHHLRFETVSTEVTVANGQSIDLGGLAGDNEFYRYFLIGADHLHRQQSISIVMTPTIL